MNRYLPGVSQNPLKLGWRLLTHPNPAARSALFMALAGIAAMPIDGAWGQREAKLYSRASKSPVWPIILVCGPPRSGTTLVAQYLINAWRVGYLNNLTSLFPRSPLVARAVFQRRIPDRIGNYRVFYGRSRGLSGVNDALYIWDRWLGANRHEIPNQLEYGSDEALPRFFAALQAQSPKPIVNKVNRLMLCADLVAPLLPKATFLCLHRDPVMLAQSLFIARQEITGDPAASYGPRHPDPSTDDPIEDVCRQVLFYEQQMREQQSRLGPERFRIVSYETFCRDPAALLAQLEQSVQPTPVRRLETPAPTRFEVSDQARLPIKVLERFQERLGTAAEPGSETPRARSMTST